MKPIAKIATQATTERSLEREKQHLYDMEHGFSSQLLYGLAKTDARSLHEVREEYITEQKDRVRTLKRMAKEWQKNYGR